MANLKLLWFRFSCVADYGLAVDWGLVSNSDSIGYWGHECDGDEPSLSYCCNSQRKWIGQQFRDSIRFRRFHHDDDIAIQCGFTQAYDNTAAVCSHRSFHCPHGN